MMDSFKYEDVRLEKANALSRNRDKLHRIRTLFRFIEFFVFIIVVSKFSFQFFKFDISGEYFGGVTLISPRFVFVLGNAIVVVLLVASGKLSPEGVEKGNELYDEYVQMRPVKQRVPIEMSRKHIEKMDWKPVARGEECSPGMRRSKSENGRLAAFAEEEMSCEEFRRTVEAFIERQQRFLKEEE